MSVQFSKVLLFLSITFGLLTAQISTQFDTLALTPPMGWNSWNHYHCNINESIVRQTADAMVKNGLKAAGYRYVIIDDCWQISRDSSGNIQADPKKFPSGIKALADYVHSKGLKFGLYSDAGTKTCQGRPGSKNYEYRDARQYAEWGVDYVKYDWCYTDGQDPKYSYQQMRIALNLTGRPIVFSVCDWGIDQPWLWGAEIGANLWRTTGDIAPSWESFVNILDWQVGLEKYAGPGHWNDPDMLEVGNSGLSLNESRAHFSLWCILAAPLIAGNDLIHIKPEITAILTNREVIAVDQDSLGKQGTRIKDYGSKEVWAKELRDGGRAVVLFNRDSVPAKIRVSWSDLNFTPSMKANVRDLWKHEDLGEYSGSFSAEVAPHDVVMVRITPMSSGNQNVVINEINYHSSDSLNTGDWVELYNPDSEKVYLSGWMFSNGNDNVRYQFPTTAILEPHGYFVLCNDVQSFKQFHPDVTWAMGNFDFDLPDSNGVIYLYDLSHQTVDEVRYSNKEPWPREADGQGYTLELKNPYWDNNNAQNWAASKTIGGTPGSANSVLTVDIQGSQFIPKTTCLIRNAPNPFNNSTVITYYLGKPMSVRLSVFDVLGRQVCRLVNGFRQAGEHHVKFNGRSLSSGIYYYRLQAGSRFYYGKMLLMK